VNYFPSAFQECCQDHQASPPEHTVRFYSRDADLLGAWVETVAQAIEVGNAVICIATRVHLEAIARRLRKRIPQIELVSQRRNFFPLNVAEILSAVAPEGQFDESRASELFEATLAETRAAVNHDTARIVVLGEMVASLWSMGKYDDVVRWEQLCNSLGQRDKISIHCGYPMRFLSREDASDHYQLLCSQHSDVVVPKSVPLVTSKEAAAFPGIELEEVMAQAEELLKEQIRLPYPEWQSHYIAALGETNRRALFKAVEIAEAAILTRLCVLQIATGDVERHQLKHAYHGLQMMKRRKLGFSQ
jgi:hypothetical protein